MPSHITQGLSTRVALSREVYVFAMASPVGGDATAVLSSTPQSMAPAARRVAFRALTCTCRPPSVPT